MTDQALPFGAFVSVTQKLVRHREYGRLEVATWRPRKHVTSGIYLGERTLANGVVHYDREEGNHFEPKAHIRVALVCTGPRSNPIYVPLDAIEVAE